MNTTPVCDRDGYIWYDGKLVDWKDAKLHVLSYGFQYGYSVFEGIRAYDGKIFKLKEHIKRFFNSAKLLGFEIQFSAKQLEDACHEVINTQECKYGYFRTNAWAGANNTFVGSKNPPHVTICYIPRTKPFERDVNKKTAMKLDIAELVKPSGASFPYASKASGLYCINTIVKQKALANGFDDAMMLDYRGYIAEATTSNIFIVFGQEVHTPIADCFLNGITRQTVIELAQKNGFKTIERHIKPEELKNADEVFITGTACEILPITSIGAYKFNRGDVTRALHNNFYDLVMGR
jgi:branched-chain amino acid aminotransferase